MANPGLIKITKAQWRSSAAGKRGASWSDFVRSYLAHHGVTQQSTNPFAPLTPDQQNAAAQGLVQPIIKSATADINNQFNQQQRLGASAVRGYTQQFADDLRAINGNVAGLYADAGSTIGSAYDSIRGQETDQGKQALQALAAKQHAIGANDPSLLSAAGLYGTAAGNTGAQRAIGATQLAMRGAGAGAYAAALPGIAALAGARNLRLVNEQAGLGRRTALQQLLGKVPEMTSQALSQIQSNEVNKAVANATASYHDALVNNASSLLPYQQASYASSATGDKVTVDPATGAVVDTGKPKASGKGTTLSAASKLSNDRQVQNGAVAIAQGMHKGNGKVDPTTAAFMRSLGIPVDTGVKPVDVAFRSVVAYYKLHGYRNTAKEILWTNAFDALAAAGYDPTVLPEYKQLVKAQQKKK